VRLVERAIDFMDGSAWPRDADAKDRLATASDGEMVALVLGDEGCIADIAGANQAIELRTVAPRSFVQVVGCEEDGAGGEEPRVAEDAERFDGGGDSCLHVGGAAAGELLAVGVGSDKREMDRVEMAIEAERWTRLSRVEADGDCGSGGMAAGGTFDGEAIGCEKFGQAIGDFAGASGGAVDGAEIEGCIDEAGARDSGAEGV
jgi:hypothetical protein